jgi:phosphoribosylanthranilate isomerase
LNHKKENKPDMGLKTLVKLSQVTNLSDARYAAGMGVQMVGFNINPESDFYIDPDKFKGIIAWISGVTLIGEFEGSVFSYNAGYNFDYIQISNPDFVKAITGLKKKLIFQIDLDIYDEVAAEKIMTELKDKVEYFLVTKSDEKLNGKEIKSWARLFPIILGFGLQEETIEQVLLEYPIKGISLIGGEEKVVGFKDYDQLAGILERLQTEKG